MTSLSPLVLQKGEKAGNVSYFTTLNRDKKAFVRTFGKHVKLL